MKFVHLHVHSHYSLLDGLPKPAELVAKAKELGMDAVALTDHGSMYGIIEFYKYAKKQGVKPIIGAELYIAPRRMQDKQAGIDDKRFHITLLAETNTGYKNLIKLVTAANLEGFYYKPRIDKETLAKYHEGIIALSGCLGGEIPRAIAGQNFELAEELVRAYKEIFGPKHFYLELAHHPNIKLQDAVNKKLIEYAERFGLACVATCDVHYLNKDDAKAQDTLMAVQTGAKLGEGDRISLAQDDFSFTSADEMYAIFPYQKSALENTQKIADRCAVDIELGKIQLPHFHVPEGETQDSYLRKLCMEYLPKRYQEATQEVLDRLDYELSVITKTGFASYFLIVQDFVNWAKSHGVVVGPGRGSAAGSITSYILNITNVDPIKYDLIFERFLNPERISMPDIDIDFADTGRDKVLEYVAAKYGSDHVGQIITFGTMAARAAVRDTGRALGIAYGFCDTLAKLIPFGSSLTDALASTPELKTLYDTNADAKLVLDMAKKLEGVSRHASVHACGVVVSKDPLAEIVPLQYATRAQEENGEQNGAKQIVTQYEMHAIEDLGLLKMDFLGLKNLSIIENTINLIEARHGKRVNLDKIPLDDKKTYKLFQEARTTGVFQLESAGMKRYLKELVPTEFEDIVAMVALFRPGPMELIPKFIARKHGREPIEHIYPAMGKILKNTYGIMIYQEQVMEIAKEMAGFTLPQADTLRKAIGKKIKSLLEEQKSKLISGMIANGVSEKIAHEIWKLIEPFDRYGFNRSHAVCYALIGYQTAFLKAHFPAEFMAALMTSDLADIERVAFLVQEAKTMGIEVLPPAINKSKKIFTVVSDKEIRFGLVAVKNVGENFTEAIIASRGGAPFTSIEDFIERTRHKDLNKKSFEALIKCGAMDDMGERNQLLTNLEMLLEYARETQKNADSSQMGLFGESDAPLGSIRMKEAEPATRKQKLAWEKELLGLYVSDHPLADYQEKLSSITTPIRDITSNVIGKTVKLGGILSNMKKIVTKKGDPMAFANLQDMTGTIEVVIFPETLQKTNGIWQDDAIILVSGKVDMRDGAYKLIVSTAKALV
ncbi:DNA polymerase III subunit alpha [Candidatus Azambacteria bacterium]|nr:DNA polymerase III subunit alpha [Candidatus Azambacteria bacterium]